MKEKEGNPSVPEDKENITSSICNLRDPIQLTHSTQNTANYVESWIQCDGCMMWSHMMCIGFDDDNVLKPLAMSRVF